MPLLNSKKTKMRYNNLGATGLMVSELSFGCMTFTRGGGMLGSSGGVQGEQAFELMKVAFEHGINFFDNAEAYGGAGVSEEIMGEAIRLGLERGVWEREDLVISTKLYLGGRGDKDSINSIGLSRKHLFEGLKASLKRMQLEYVDLVFCHRPDPLTPIEETVRGMNHLIDRGMAFYWGTSEWNARQLQEARDIAKALGMVPPLFDQCQYSMIERHRVEVEYAPLYPELGLTVWSPLAGGALSDKYIKGGQGRMSKAGSGNNPMAKRMAKRLEKSKVVVQHIAPIAEQLGCTVSQLALAWCAANPHVSTVILGATKIEQLEENLASVDVIEKLTPAVMQQLEHAMGTTPDVDEVTRQVETMRGVPSAHSRL